MKKILYIATSSNPFNGSTKSLEIILEKLEMNNIPFGVVLPSRTGVYNEWKQRGWVVYVLNYRMSAWPKAKTTRDILLFIPKVIFHYILNLRAIKDLKKIIKNNKYTIIHSNASITNIGSKTSKSLKLPHVWHIREYGDIDLDMRLFPSKHSLEKELNQTHNFPIAITSQLHSYYNLARGGVLYDAVLHEYKPNINHQRKKFVLFVGRLCEQKGIEDVINVFNTVKTIDPEYKLVIAGHALDYCYQEKLNELVQSLGLSEHVDFLGGINNPLQLMKEAKCLVMASSFEALGRVTIEAMSVGCLVVGKNCHGTKEQFDRGLELTKNEIGLRYNTYKELETLMTEIISNDIKDYYDIIERAQYTVYKLYHIDEFYAQLINIYDHLLNLSAISSQVR